MRRSSLLLGTALALTGCDPVARGDDAWRDGRVDEAVQAWTDADGLDPAHQGRLARAQIRLGQLDAAAQTLDRLAADQRTAEGHLASGLLLLHLGDLPGAAAAFAAGLEQEPLPELLVNQCMALGQLGHLTARSLCQEAIEADPEDPRPYLGLAATSVGELEDASREAIGIAISRAGPAGGALRTQLAPWISELWLALGELGAACSWGLEGGAGDLGTARACVASGQHASARPLLEALAGGDAPEIPLRLLLQQDLDLAEKHPAGPDRVQMVASAQRWQLRLEPLMGDRQDPAWLTDSGRLAWLDERPQAAEDAWQAALALAPDEAAPRLNLAKALDRRGRRSEARALLAGAEAAGTLGGAAHAVQLALAKLELLDGEPEAARPRLEALHAACLAEHLPACAARAALPLARLEAAAGQVELAVSHLQQALSFGGDTLREDIARDASFDPLREDLRYRQLVSGD